MMHRTLQQPGTESSGPWTHPQGGPLQPFPPNSKRLQGRPRKKQPPLFHQSPDDAESETASGNSLPEINGPTSSEAGLQESKLPKQVLFYRNGDRYYKGKRVRVTPQRYLTLDGLLSDLTKSVSLPYGVRRLYTPVGGTRVRRMEEIRDGGAYVCASFEKFKRLKYGSVKERDWRTTRKSVPNENFLYDNSGGNQYPPEGKYATAYGKGVGRAAEDAKSFSNGQESGTSPPDLRALPPRYLNSLHNKPRLIKIVKAGKKPYQSVSLLLNRRSILSYEQLMQDISEAFGLPNHRNYKIGRLYNARGDEIKGVADFFRDQNGVVIGATVKNHIAGEELVQIFEEVLPDSMLSRKLRIKQMRDTGVKGDSGIENDDELSSQENPSTGQSRFPQGTRKKGDKAGRARRKKVEQHAGGDNVDSPKKKTEKVGVVVSSQGTSDSVSSKDGREKEEHRTSVNQLNSNHEFDGVGSPRKETDRVGVGESSQDTSDNVSSKVGGQDNRQRISADQLDSNPEESVMNEEKNVSEIRDAQGDPQVETSVPIASKVQSDTRETGEEPTGIEGEVAGESSREGVNGEENEETVTGEDSGELGEEERLARLLSKIAQEEAEKELMESSNLQELEPSKLEGRTPDDEEMVDASGNDQPMSPENSGEVEDQVSPEEKPYEGTLAEESTEDNTQGTEHKSSEDLIDSQDGEIGSSTPDVEDSNKGEELQDQSKDAQVVDSPEEESSGMPNADDGHATDRSEDVASPAKDFEFSGRSGRFVIQPRETCMEKDVLVRYTLGEKVGDGNFADVYAGMRRRTGEEFAVKRVDKSKLGGKESMIENEIAILKQIDHPNIIKLYEEYETRDFIYLVMEYVRGGDLFDAIIDSVKFTEAEASLMVQDLASALDYLHQMSVVHRDMKPENLLVNVLEDDRMQLKLADFGLAMEVLEPVYTVCGTPTYVAPEILAETGYGLPIDLWALGVIMYILLCGFPPFRSPDKNQDELFKLIQSGKFEYITPYWNNITADAKDLIDHLLVVDQSKRFTAQQVLQHPWIVGGERCHSTTNLQREVSMNIEKNFDRPPSAKR